MARLRTTGFELNSVTDVIENNTHSGPPTIDTTTIRSGVYALQKDAGVNTGICEVVLNTAGTNQGWWMRGYININAYPGSLKDGGLMFRDTGGAVVACIGINSDGTLELWHSNFPGSGTQIGSDSAALSLDTWYRLELFVDTTTNTSCDIEAKIDGTAFATTSGVNLSGLAGGAAIQYARVGQALSDSTAEFFFDDVAVNDDTGSFQNSYPGEGEVIRLKPDGDGDNTAWTNTYTNIDEVTPDDTTTLISSATLDQIEDVNIEATPAAMASDDVINVVHVGCRFRRSNNFDSPTFVVRVKASASGTVEESSSMAPVSTTWLTNNVNTTLPGLYPLTLYDLPGSSTTAWTKTDLDAAQIGVRQTKNAISASNVTTLWMYVDHKPAPAAPSAVAVKPHPTFFAAGGVGIS